jgi:2-amino-4-hydroxy-6-hydroxymethyldihydropteridine diphosphokinase
VSQPIKPPGKPVPHKPPSYDAIIALGSNIGDKVRHIADAVGAFTRDGCVQVVTQSANYQTPPWGKTDQDWFVNGVMSITTQLPVYDLLGRCQAVERELGRERLVHWGPRVIDLDILVYRDLVSTDPDLILPHPHMTERAFVLRPLLDVAPDLVVKGKTIREWLIVVPHADVTPI